MDFIIIIALLMVNGLFAMYEMALVSSSRARLEMMSAAGNKNAARVISQIASPEKMLSTIQVGITLIGIVSGAFGGVALSDDLRPIVESVDVLAPYAANISIIVVVGSITYLSLIVGELVPKSIALANAEMVAVRFLPFMVLMTRIAFPFVWLLTMSTKLVTKLFGVQAPGDRPMSEEELKFILHQSSQQGVIDQQEGKMLKDVFRFGDCRASEVMTRRGDMVKLKINATKHEVIQTIASTHFSTYPVSQGEQNDQIVGTVSVKDIVLLISNGQPFDLNSIVQEPIYVPQTMLASRIIELFKTHKRKLAIVMSEYGSVEGIVTLHDLSEKIFGDMPEENQTESTPIVTRADGSLLVDGAISIDDFMDSVGVAIYSDLDNLGCNTLGGMAMAILARVPQVGDQFVWREMSFEVVDMDGSRVDKLLVNQKKNS
ncbi:MAG: hemolysin family protein [Mucinivorans sp.]